MNVSVAVAAAVLGDAGVGSSNLRVLPVQSGNTVVEIVTDSEIFFLKVPTKDLEEWADFLDGAAFKVTVESAAFACLEAHGLGAPQVLVANTTSDNAVGRPYLLTREAPGEPFTAIVTAGRTEGWRGPLRAVGEFLGEVHRIEFAERGYIVTADGPSGPPPQAHLSSSHSVDVLHAGAMADLAAARPAIPDALADEVEERLVSILPVVGHEYGRPRFVLNAFHPNHPYLAEAGGDWRVTACLDLDSASGGCVLGDLVIFGVGMMFRLGPEVAWWEPLFQGYGTEPPFEAMRYYLLATCFYWHGEDGRLEATYRRLLDAMSWEELFNAHRAG